jgi:signal transduction histidine kinase
MHNPDVVETTIDVLVRFARLVSGASAPEDVLPLLADAAVERSGCDAAAVVTIDAAGDARVVAGRSVPAAVMAWKGEGETIGAELERALIAASGGAFAMGLTIPLVASGSLFGALVVLCRDERMPGAEQRKLIEALVDLAAISFERAHQIAELRRSRELLASSERLRALGQMAAGISHDLKNILNPLSLQVQLLERRAGGQAGEIIGNMKDVLRHGVEVVERLRDFSRQAPERRIEPIELDRVASEAVELVRPRFGDVAVRVELGAPPIVNVAASELMAALVNLIVNALDALRGAGTITVRTGAAAGQCWVEVADDGPGMTEEVRQRVFDPFFTTKGKDGTGLGLAMVYAFVQRHGGTITLDTEPGRGATFRMSFPAR